MYKYVKKFSPIQSKDNPKLIEASKLRDKKHRRDSGLFAVEGIKLFGEAMSSDFEAMRVFITQSAAHRFSELTALEGSEIPVFVIPDRLYNKLSDEMSPQGIFTVMAKKKQAGEVILPAIMLCGVQDPGNVGTVMRTALAFGINSVVLAGGCADIYSPKTMRSAMGSVFRLNTLVIPDPLEAVGILRSAGAAVYAATLNENSSDIRDMNITSQTVFVLGSEGSGLPEQVIRDCDGSVIIPIGKHSESLNVAACGAVLMWEMKKVISGLLQ